jgi:hypothetical protein
MDNGVVLSSSSPKNIMPGVLDSLQITFTPDYDGVYDFYGEFISDQIDDVPVNNQFTEEIAQVVTTAWVYARDEDNPEGELGGGFDLDSDGSLETFGFEAGNFFDIYNNATLSAVEIGIADNQLNIGAEIYAIVYKIENNDDFIAQTASDIYMVQDAELGQIITVSLDVAIDVLPGERIFVAVGTGSSFEFYVMTSGTPIDSSSLLYTPTMSAHLPNGKFNLDQTPVVRLNFKSVGLEEDAYLDSKLGQNAPNPFAENSTINFDLNEATEVSFEIRDLSGQLVKTYDLDNLSVGAQSLEISAADLAAGAYTYTIKAGNKTVTKRMIVQK